MRGLDILNSSQFCSYFCEETREDSFTMRCKGKLLLTAVVFTAFCCRVTAKQSEQLDMALNSVDDLYTGCNAKVYEMIVNGNMLKEELSRSPVFSTSWNSQNPCPKESPGKTKKHLRALSVLNSEDMFPKTFNKAVKKLGANATTYKSHFHFKSLHFLLMDSMKEQQPKDCKTGYSLKEGYMAEKGSEVRLGQFLKTATDYKQFKKFADLSESMVLNITSCFFANLGADICSNEEAILLSPAEVFMVEDVANLYDEINDEDYVMITLKHVKVLSLHDCYISSRSTADSATCWLVLGLAALAAWSCHVFDYLCY